MLGCLLLVGATVGGASYGWSVGRPDGSGRSRAVEAGGLTLAGGLLATSFVAVLLWLGDDSRFTDLLIGWALFFVNGVVDTILAPFGITLLTRPSVLLATGLLVGTFTGAMHGAHRVYPWRRRGALMALVDATWALSGSTTGGILHAINLRIGQRAPEERTGSTRFLNGFHPPGKPTYAFTQGAVLSNCRRGPGAALFEHETTHVRQSRMFGPLYTVSYLGWMLVILPVALAVGIAKRQPASRMEGYCYLSNPWEVWAYVVQRKLNGEPAGGDSRTRMADKRCLTEPVAAAVGGTYLALVGLAFLVVAVMALG